MPFWLVNFLFRAASGERFRKATISEKRHGSICAVLIPIYFICLMKFGSHDFGASDSFALFWSIVFFSLLTGFIIGCALFKTKVPTWLFWTIAAILWPLTAWWFNYADIHRPTLHEAFH